MSKEGFVLFAFIDYTVIIAGVFLSSELQAPAFIVYQDHSTHYCDLWWCLGRRYFFILTRVGSRLACLHLSTGRQGGYNMTCQVNGHGIYQSAFRME